MIKMTLEDDFGKYSVKKPESNADIDFVYGVWVALMRAATYNMDAFTLVKQDEYVWLWYWLFHRVSYRIHCIKINRVI